jgi:NAD(P)-dependent dehydrogenase (short-subunit alcohol dehydrogenase family)
MSLQDQVILITGCSSGIGRALALELTHRGHRVFATARKPAGLGAPTHTERDVSAPLRCETLALDVTDPASIERAVEEVVSRAGRIDMLINNAGFNLVGPLAEVPLEDVRRLFDTNITGLLATSQAVIPHMARRRSGRIVNIGSVVGLLPTPFAGPYCATKSAVHMLSTVLRMECAPFNIGVVVVQPGGVQSSIAETASAGLARYATQSSLYRNVHHFIEKRASASQDKAMDTCLFAQRVASAILAEKAPRIVREGRGAQLYPALSRVPGVLLDRTMQAWFGLDSLKTRVRPETS